MTRMTLLKTFPKIFAGKHIHHHAIRAARSRSVELFETSPIDLMIDGEVVRRNPKRISVRPNALDVFV
jgi:diacylglycerol kinase (ATP)